MDREKLVYVGLFLASLSVVLAVIYIAMGPPPQPAERHAKYIVVIPITTPITSCWVDPLVPKILALNSSDNVAGVILYIDSPGGTLDATEALYGALRGLDKPIYAVVVGLDASGAYYVSMTAQRIYVSGGSLVGNIGAWTVIEPYVFWTPLPAEVYSSGYDKLFGMSLPQYYNYVGQAAEAFLDAVEQSRGARLRASPDLLATGRLFAGAEAVKLGLADQIGGISQAVADMARSLGLVSYKVVSIYSYFGVSPPNCTASLSSEAKVPLGVLLNSTKVPVFYMYLGAVQLKINASAPSYQPPQFKPSGKYVVVDLSHGNLVPQEFIQALASYLALQNCSITFATSSDRLVQLLKNATGLVVAEPTEPYSSSAEAIESFVERGGRLAVFYDPRLGYSLLATTPSEPIYLDSLLTPFGISIMPGYLYNTSASLLPFSYNWQFVESSYVNSTDLYHGDFLFYNPAALAGSGVGVYVNASLLGYGPGLYPVVLQRGNVTAVGTIMSFMPYFIEQGNNSRLLYSIAGWLCGPPRGA